MKHPIFVVRKIKNGKIKWNKRYWATEGNVSHIEGKRMVFGTYAPEYELLGMNSTPELYKCRDIESTEGRKLWTKYCKIMGKRQKGDGLQISGGSYTMDTENDKFVAYKSRNIYWWKEKKE